MPTAAAKARKEGERAYSALRARLEARREELEAAALARARSISDPPGVVDPAYREGLRAAVAAAVAYGIETTGREAPDPPIPVALLAQARMAARAGVPLDTVLRRYFAGYSLLGYFILEEAAGVGMTDGAELKRLLGFHAGLFDRLLEAVSEEHGRETQSQSWSGEQRRARCVARLLAGDAHDTTDLAYDLDGWHVGVLAAGPQVGECLRGLANALAQRFLLLKRADGCAWAWLGSSEELDFDLAQEWLAQRSTQITAALGEPARDLRGWRLTHRQARAAFPVAERGRKSIVRYAEVALPASLLSDDLLADSLCRLYLAPLERERDGGAIARETLRAYLAAGRNVTSAAAVLGVNRNTVANRLRAVESRIGCPLTSCASDIEAALRLDELTRGGDRVGWADR